MNIRKKPDFAVRDNASLERDLAKALLDLFSGVSWLEQWRIEPSSGADRSWDLLATGPGPAKRKAFFCIECKGPNFQPSQFHSLIDRACAAGKNVASAKVLAMPRISSRMAVLCERHGWSWYDLAGNCRLELPGVLLIERSGREPVRVRSRSGANLGTPEAGRVVRALLAPENAGRRWTQRSIVEHFVELPRLVPAPSLALVNKVVQFLRDQAFLESLPNRGFRVRDHEGMLQAWRDAYRFDRHERRHCFTLLRGRELQDRIRQFESAHPGRVELGVFTAAEFQAPSVRQPRTWLYVEPSDERNLLAAVDAKPVDSGENLVVLLADDPGVFYKSEATGDRMACTNAVQTYVDLMHAGGRGEEAAEAVLQQRLKPAWAATSR